MQKLDGVQNVRVSLNEGLTMLDLTPGNSVTLAKLRQIIKNNGFVTKNVSMRARGSAADPRAFVVSVTNERLDLSSAPKQTGDAWQLVVPGPP